MSQQVLPLAMGSEQEVEIRGGERHAWEWHVPADQVGEVEVRQAGVDVIVRLFAGSGGEAELEVDGLGGAWGPERVFVVPEVGTRYRLEIEPLDSVEIARRYALVGRELRPATEADRLRALAERRFDEAERLRRQETRESRFAALAPYAAAKNLFGQAGFLRGELDCLQRLGWMQEMLGQRTEARLHYEALLAKARLAGDQLEEGDTLNRLGSLAVALGDDQTAQRLHEQARAIADALQHAPLRARSLNNLAILRSRQEDLAGAIRDLQTVRQLWRELGRPLDEANTLYNLSFSLRAQGKFEEALDALEDCRELRLANGDPQGAALALFQIGTTQQASGQLEAAARTFAATLGLAAQDLPAEQRVMAGNNLGLLAAEQGQDDDAIRHFEAARRDGRLLALPRHEAMACLNLAALRESRGETMASLELLGQARTLFAPLADRRHLAACDLIEARALRRLGNHDQALAKLEAATGEVETLRLAQAGRALRMAFFATRQSYYDEWIDLLWSRHQATGELTDAERALAVAERRRARSLLDALAEGTLRYDGDGALLDQERRLGEELADVGRELDLGGADDQTVLLRRKRDLLLRLETTRAEIRAASPQYSQLTRPHALGVAAIRRDVLDVGTRLLVYSLGAERSLLFTLGRDEPLRMVELPGRGVVEAAVDRARMALTSRLRGREAAHREAIGALSDLVLGPLAGSLDGRRLAIVADGALETVPFGALLGPPAADGTRAWLLEGREVVNLPSASAFAALRAETRGRRPPRHDVAVFANPTFAEGTFKPLPATADEANAIRALARPDSSRFLLGFDANRQHFERPELAEFRILHFATHGLLDDANPELSGLALATMGPDGQPVDGFIRAHELVSRRLGAELVVLSACQTGMGRQVRGEGLVGLPQAFLYAGVPRVVVSLWDVADGSTATLMRYFYQAMDQGLAPAAALREAQLTMLRSPAADENTPYHWAPFILIGDWRALGSSPDDGGMGQGGDGTVIVSDPAKGSSYEGDGDGKEGGPPPGALDLTQAPAPPKNHPDDFVNGVDGDTGELLPVRPEPEPPELCWEEREHRRLVHWAENRSRLRLPMHGVDPERLEEAGWGVLFGPGVTQEVKKELAPLLKIRSDAAGDLFKTFELPENADALDFLADKKVAFGPAVPAKLPYYLLVVGDPDLLPFDFQTQLDVQYAVGRLHFDDPGDYGRYARAVLAAEAQTKVERPAVFWGADVPGDEHSRWMIEGLVDPLCADLRSWRETEKRGRYAVVRAPDGRKATLAGLLAGQPGGQPPALLFTGSHGMTFSQDPKVQRERQGALLCEDWRPGTKPIPPGAFFAGEDLPAKADLAGLVSLHFACHSAGSSRRDPFVTGPLGEGKPQAPRAFVSRLAQRLLASGAQAVVGHVDRAWRTSFTWQDEGDQTRVFSSLLRQLTAGRRLGYATETVNTRYAECASHLQPLLEHRPLPDTPTAARLERLRKTTLDARNFLVIGDPAVRLVGARRP